jgi:uncharacterized protein
MNDVLGIVTFVVVAVWKVLPAFIISVLLGVLIRELKLDGVIRKAFSARIGLSIILAAAVGAFSPFCSCTVIPVVSGMLLSGVPLAPVMAFWIASPTMDPEIFALTVATLGWPLALARLGATLLLSLGGGYLTLLLTQSQLLPLSILRQEKVKAASCCATPAPAAFVPVSAMAAPGGFIAMSDILTVPAAVVAAPVSTCSCNTPAISEAPWQTTLFANFRQLDAQQIAHNIAIQSWKLGRWLVLAFFLEALILHYVPQTAIASLLGQQNVFAVPLAALIGIPLYLNNLSALPIVGGLLEQGMQPGAAIAFLIAGPVTTIPAMTAVWGVVKPRVFALYLSIGLFGAMIFGLLTNIMLG